MTGDEIHRALLRFLFENAKAGHPDPAILEMHPDDVRDLLCTGEAWKYCELLPQGKTYLGMKLRYLDPRRHQQTGRFAVFILGDRTMHTLNPGTEPCPKSS